MHRDLHTRTKCLWQPAKQFITNVSLSQMSWKVVSIVLDLQQQNIYLHSCRKSV